MSVFILALLAAPSLAGDARIALGEFELGAPFDRAPEAILLSFPDDFTFSVRAATSDPYGTFKFRVTWGGTAAVDDVEEACLAGACPDLTLTLPRETWV
jgi:hypothetical protein